MINKFKNVCFNLRRNVATFPTHLTLTGSVFTVLMLQLRKLWFRHLS